MRVSRLRQLGWLLLIGLASVTTRPSTAAALKLVMRFLGLAG
jgi:hypothetical protein